MANLLFSALFVKLISISSTPITWISIIGVTTFHAAFSHEGTARGAWYNKGKHQDVEINAILYKDIIAS